MQNEIINILKKEEKFSDKTIEEIREVELNDFSDGIHKCQYVIGMRYAREHRPDLFPMK